MSVSLRPLPLSTPLSSALSHALGDGLKLQQCMSCGLFVYYPRVACPECLSDALEWQRVSGLGELLSYGVVWRPLHPAFADSVPMHLCAVRLREGPVVIALLHDAAPEDVAIGMAVCLVSDEIALSVRLPCFVPAR